VTLAAGGALAALIVGGSTASAVSFGIERATVTITPPTKYVDARSTLHGAISGGAFQTQRLQVSLTETMQGSASGAGSTPGRYATGWVVFNHDGCNLIGIVPHQYCAPFPSVPSGTVLYMEDGVRSYVLLSTVSCFCGETVPVRGAKAGAIENTGAHTVNLFTNRLIRAGGFTPWESADNPSPITGGSNGTAYPVVRQADVDAVGATVRSRLAADLQSALRVKAGDLHYLADAPVMVTSSDTSAGAASISFQVTVSGSLTATAFADSDARSRIARALAKEIAPGWRLVGQPVITDYKLEASTPDGGVTVSGDAGGYEALLVSTAGLPARLSGLGPESARSVAQAAAPGSTVDVRVSPASIPWLPMNPAHIEVVVSSQ
jgi:hypothetical protein